MIDYIMTDKEKMIYEALCDFRQMINSAVVNLRMMRTKDISDATKFYYAGRAEALFDRGLDTIGDMLKQIHPDALYTIKHPDSLLGKYLIRRIKQLTGEEPDYTE